MVGAELSSSGSHGQRSTRAFWSGSNLSARADAFAGQGRSVGDVASHPGEFIADFRTLSRRRQPGTRVTRVEDHRSSRHPGSRPSWGSPHGLAHWGVEYDPGGFLAACESTDVCCRRASSLRDGLRLPRRAGSCGWFMGDASCEFCTHLVVQHERPGFNRSTDPSFDRWSS